ncbi:hypothetical protein [Spirosoma fluminis]
MLTVKAPNIVLTFPSRWEEVTLAQFATLHRTMLRETGDETQFLFRWALEAFASDLHALHQMGAAEETQILSRLTFLDTLPDFENLPVPQRIAGVTPPSELGACTLLQKWSVDEQIEELEEEGQVVNFITIALPLLSIYLYPLLTGKPLTATSQIEQIKEQIEGLPCTGALALSAFFLRSYKSTSTSGKTSFSISPTPTPKKTWLGRWFPNWKITPSTAFWRRSPKSAD